MASKDSINRLWRMAREQERSHEATWGKAAQQLEQEWEAFLKELVDAGEADTLEEAELSVWEDYEVGG